MNPGLTEDFIIDELLGNQHHGETETKSTTSSTNSDKEKSAYCSNGKNCKKNSKRKRENETKIIGKKEKKTKLTKNESVDYGFDDVCKGREQFSSSLQPRLVPSQVEISPMESLTETCLKYELLRENYQNLRHSYLHLKRRYDQRDLEMQMSLDRKNSPGKPLVKEIQELEGVVDPLLTSPPAIREVEVDEDGAKWQIKFVETSGSLWKVRWERV